MLKNFNMPRSERQQLQFHAEAFNVFYHPSFAVPSASINSGSFGIISSTEGTARQLRLALRFDF